jgi:hypothetical protein
MPAFRRLTRHLDEQAPFVHHGQVGRERLGRFGPWRACLLALLLLVASCSGGATRHVSPNPPTGSVSRPSSPVVLNDVSGHFALVVTKTGDYPLESPITEFFGLPSPQLLVSRDACHYLSGRVVSLAKKPIKIAAGGQRAILTAVLRVTSLRRPVVIAYEVAYTRRGPDVASIDGGTRPACIAG